MWPSTYSRRSLIPRGARPKRRLGALITAIAAAALIPGHGSAAGVKWERAARAPGAEEEQARHEAGRKLYNFNCYFCHGYSGDAKTQASLALRPPPRDFTSSGAASLSREAMTGAVTNGRPGTAMQSFKTRLSPAQIELVVDFIREEFIANGAVNTWYHTKENGWEQHDAARGAFPFATGELPFDTPDETLNEDQRAGKRLFLRVCVTCHDGAHVRFKESVWERAPGLTARQRKGETLYQENCAFCHARDGTGRNWIGAFLRPHPRDLTGAAMETMTRARLAAVIREGIAGASMPAWKDVFDDRQIEAIIDYIGAVFHPLRAD
ncbi:MAG: c-type cytochrome [Nitrospinae bacterium]|nr:c-type cytochrome [Nitrospinota bacterium]